VVRQIAQSRVVRLPKVLLTFWALALFLPNPDTGYGYAAGVLGDLK
jgi:hypothetical protein